jgi:hypothetical protein
MFKTRKIRVIGLVVVAALVLIGGVYGTAAWAAPGPSTTGTTTQTATTADQAQLRAAILEMIKDHMGLTGAEAEQWADRMLSRMQNAGWDSTDLQAMIDRCEQYMDGNGNTDGYGYGSGACGAGTGTGMMGGRGMMGSGAGMMGGAYGPGTGGCGAYGR